MTRRLEVTIWSALSAVSRRSEFFPFDGWEARWTILCPEGSRLISCEDVGIVVEEPNGGRATPKYILAYAEIGGLGYDIRDGWESDRPAADSAPKEGG